MKKRIVTPVMKLGRHGRFVRYGECWLCGDGVRGYWKYPKDAKRFWLVVTQKKHPDSVKFSIFRNASDYWSYYDGEQHDGFSLAFSSWLSKQFPDAKTGDKFTYYVCLQYEE